MTNITLDRRELLAPLFPDQADWLFVSGLAGSSKDAAGLTEDGSNLFTMAGCMGSAVATGLGMAAESGAFTAMMLRRRQKSEEFRGSPTEQP